MADLLALPAVSPLGDLPPLPCSHPSCWVQVLEAVASDALAPYFSSDELRELLQFERAARVLRMRSEEEEAASGAGGDAAAAGEPR